MEIDDGTELWANDLFICLLLSVHDECDSGSHPSKVLHDEETLPTLLTDNDEPGKRAFVETPRLLVSGRRTSMLTVEGWEFHLWERTNPALIDILTFAEIAVLISFDLAWFDLFFLVSRPGKDPHTRSSFKRKLDLRLCSDVHSPKLLGNNESVPLGQCISNTIDKVHLWHSKWEWRSSFFLLLLP